MDGGLWPEEFGEFRLRRAAAVPIAAEDRALFAEHGLMASERGQYARADGRAMRADLYRFVDTGSADAAYRWLRPEHPAVSGLDSYTTRQGIFSGLSSCVGGGRTAVRWQNYVVVLHGAVPKQDAIGALLEGLPNVDPASTPAEAESRYVVPHSERILIGPVSLERYVPRIPPSVAGFRLGGRGIFTQYETPAGRMAMTVFRYPSEAVAQERVAAFQALRGGMVLRKGDCLGIVFDPVNREEAEALLRGYVVAPGSGAVSFDPAEMIDGEMTLVDGLGVVSSGWLFGALVGAFVCLLRGGLRGADPRLSILSH